MCVYVILSGIKKMVSAFVYFANKDNIKEHFKNIHIYIYKHFPRGNANILDLNKAVIEN